MKLRRPQKIQRLKKRDKPNIVRWYFIDYAYGRVSVKGWKRDPEVVEPWILKINNPSYNVFTGWDNGRNRFIVGRGTRCKRHPRRLYRQGWRKSAFFCFPYRMKNQNTPKHLLWCTS